MICLFDSLQGNGKTIHSKKDLAELECSSANSPLRFNLAIARNETFCVVELLVPTLVLRLGEEDEVEAKSN